MPKASSLLHFKHHAYTIAVIFLSSEIMLSYSYCSKVGLIYIVIAVPSSRQLSACSKCTKVNIQPSCNICLVFNTKYTRYIIFHIYLVLYLVCLKVLCAVIGQEAE